MNVSKTRIIYVVSSLILSGLAAYFLRPYYYLSDDIAAFLGTVVAVMTALSISLLFYVGDPSALVMTCNWRILQLYRDTFKGTIVRMLFVVLIQIFALLITLVYFFVGEAFCITSSFFHWAEIGYFFLSVWAILLTIPLFFILYDKHMERYDAMIKELKDRNIKL